jgi:hypothetical protein
MKKKKNRKPFTLSPFSLTLPSYLSSFLLFFPHSFLTHSLPPPLPFSLRSGIDRNQKGIVQLICGPSSALGTTAYLINRRGIEALVANDDRTGGYCGVPIPDTMARLFPKSRYAAFPMPMHRASDISSLV